jgi:hypothetical protein
MATINSTALVCTNTGDANFRAWCSFIRDVFLMSGAWVQTPDTGQMNFATVVSPGVTNTKSGYLIVRMNDALQATSPVFVRLDFGCAAAANPGLWLTIGTGSDGAGNITNKRFDGGSTAAPTITCSSSVTVPTASFGSAASSRVQFSLFIRTTQTLLLSIERSKDTAGADTGDGLIVLWNTSANVVAMNRYVILGSAGQPTPEVGLQYILSSNNPSSFGGDVGIGLLIPIKGFAQPPGTGVVVVRSADFAAEATFTMNVYGATRTYQHLSNILGTLSSGSSDGTSRVCIRFD